jgi:hypothetical protein
VSCRYIRNQINAGAVKREAPLTTLEKAALDFLDEQTRRPDLRLDMDLQAGDIQFINNYTILHSRTGFVDGPEPHQKRHMLRLWLKFPTTWPLSASSPRTWATSPRRTPRSSSKRRRELMPKVLTDAQVATFQRDGCLSPVRAMSAERAHAYRQRFEALEARVTEIKKMKTKSHLLCPWVLEIAEDPFILDIFEDLIGPNLRCWSMAWRVKKADGETFAGWHQDSAYGAATPVVLGGLALSDCGLTQGCLRGVPGSHKWGILKHEESDDPRSILARGQFITDGFDESKAVDFALQPGEMVLFDNSLVHGSGTNFGPDRRFPAPRRDAADLGQGPAHPAVGHADARHGHLRQLRRRAAAGRRVDRDRTRQLVGDRQQAGEADLRGQQDRRERSLRGHAPRGVVDQGATPRPLLPDARSRHGPSRGGGRRL